MKNRSGFLILVLICALFMSLAASTVAVTLAYYSNLPRVYTSDDDSGRIARIGMRINLLFDRLGESLSGATYRYPDETDETATVLDPSAEWGSKQNPYVISLPRHLLNLYALQNAGYFYDRFIRRNYDDGVYNGGGTMPCFLVCKPDGTPVAIDGSQLKKPIEPIGNERYPFIGYVGGAIEEGTASTLLGVNVTADKTSSCSVIKDITVAAKIGDARNPDVGLFGRIGYLGDEKQTSPPQDETGIAYFTGYVSAICDLLLYDIRITAKERSFIGQIADHIFADSQDSPFEDDHHIGILAGHIEYAQIQNISVYYSSDSVVAIDVDDAGANYYSDSGIIGLVYNLNPEIWGNSVGSGSGTTIAGNVKGAGEEWGGSINMKTMHERLQAILAVAKTTTARYIGAQTVVVDEIEGTRTVTEETESAYPNPGSAIIRTYRSEFGGSFVFADNSAPSQSAVYDLFHGKSRTFFPKTVTTYTYHDAFESGVRISDGAGHYLNASAEGVSTGEDPAAATVWQLDAQGHLNARIEVASEIALHYLNASAGSLSVERTPKTAWTQENGEWTFRLSGAVWFLAYEGGWFTRPRDGHIFSDGVGNYLNATAAGVVNGTSAATATEWYFADVSGANLVFTCVGGAIRYLSHDTQALTLASSPANAAAWRLGADDSLRSEQGGAIYAVSHRGEWTIVPAYDYIVTDGAGHYLNATAATVTIGTDPDAATGWTFSRGSAGGELSAVINGTRYFLYNDGGVLRMSAAQSTVWTFSDGRLTDGTYYLRYANNSWSLGQSTDFYITDGAENYLCYDNGLTNATSRASATLWTMSGASSGYISVSGSTRYLRNNNGTLTTTTNTAQRTTWTYDPATNRLSGVYTAWNGTVTSYLQFAGGAWSLTSDASNRLCLLYDETENVYLNRTTTYNTGVGTDPAVATRWVWDAANQRYHMYDGTRNRYLMYYSAAYPVIANGNAPTNAAYAFRLNANGNLYATYGGQTYYVYRNGSSFGATTNAAQADVFSEIQDLSAPVPTYIELALNVGDGRVSTPGRENDVSLSRVLRSGSAVLAASGAERRLCTKTVAAEAGGYDTFFPLTASASTFDVDPKNTGYIIGGSYASYQSEWGDVRVSSYYTISGNYLRNSLYNQTRYNATHLEVLTRTHLSDGLKRISDTFNAGNTVVSTSVSAYEKRTVRELGLQKYDNARDQLHETFTEDNNTVYGVHFMDAVISRDRLITAPKVVINEVTYDNYQMPEDCIDFRLRSKGFINFFAGTYYMNAGYENNSFFSLSQIFRDETSKITEIRRIAKIYGNPNTPKRPYLYQYADEDPIVLPSGYIELFDTAWIEQPTLVTYAMYYFEVPVNEGEYALGSVANRYGAYLCYLDIGTSAASHESTIGTIDFVYDNLGTKIVTVKDTSDTDASLNYYVPSLTILYTKSTTRIGDEYVRIDRFSLRVRRTIDATTNVAGTVTATAAGDHGEYLALIRQTSGRGDEIAGNIAP